MKIKFTWKIWLWIIVLTLSLISIFITPHFLKKGVLVTNLDQDSDLFEQGLREGEIITAIDGTSISNMDEFSEIISTKTSASGEKLKTTITTSTGEYVLYSGDFPDITVSDLPLTNINTGLDLSGGARALVKGQDIDLSVSQINDLVDVVSNRLNVYGISDLTIRPVSDLAGNNFMLVEIAGATPKDLEDLISQQGKFEAKIGDEVVFIGGEKDITSVSRSGQEARVSCPSGQSDSYYCNFEFVIYLSSEAAERQAQITDTLEVNSTSQGNYLSKTLDLFIDDTLLNSLQISEGLKGQVTTQISISGSRTASTLEDAETLAQEEMNKLQTILMTGSLPYKLEIVKLDTISPTLGKSFTKYIFLAGFVALILVALIIFFRYRIKSSFLPLLICTSEIVITLGIAALIKWDLDLPSIAGILAAIGTGVDDQIVILDEAKYKRSLSLKERLKRAFTIIFGAYFTALASLLPLWWAGAGLLKGFVFTTVIGITVGVLITRPAFADLVNSFEK